ncbi:uncharacterized protein CG3556 [Orussus abietinus]|uniref:uncharacterized protein CG3556 n=1 Tax=Orussus abietinus TaxID=222816 RepID=UPI000626EBE6|nr:uncharacterized protein CG3556 [Orussus abietinus]
MWGRANMAAVVLLVLWTCLFACGKAGNTEVVVAEVDADFILERATTWLWTQRDKDAGWGNDTHWALLAIRLGNLSRDDNVPPPLSLDFQLSAKQMELELALHMSRHQWMNPFSEGLAPYALALSALCMDPRQFLSYNLIFSLHHHEPTADYDFALATLAVCSAHSHVRRRLIYRLEDILNTATDHDPDTMMMAMLALRCIVQDRRHWRLRDYFRKPTILLAHLQRADGSFGDVHTTALAMQALHFSQEPENTDSIYWNHSAALAWLSSQQKSDGSFESSVRITAEVILGIAPRNLASIRTLDCDQGITDNSPPRVTTSNSVGLSYNHSEVVTPFTDVGNSSNSGSESATQGPSLVNVSYTLWVGSNVNETYSLTVTAPKNETFYGVMLAAAEMSPHFQFAASEWPSGHYIHTLAGYKEELMSYHYWLLYRLPVPPDPSSPPGSQLVAPGGVDELQISDGEHYLFWYKKM